jgi:hypothetical protein
MKTKILLHILFGAMVLVACKKDPSIPKTTEPVMPPLTHQGLNTFGCYIDGELFVANDGESSWSAPSISGSFDEETFLLALQGNREVGSDPESPDIDNIRLRVIVNSGADFYNLHFETDHYMGYFSLGLDKCRYYHDLNNPGTCEITYLDMTKNIIAGRFEMTLINPDCEGDSLLHITDGRFDFKY